MVPNGWEKRDLQGLISVKHGFAFKSEYFSDNGDMVLLTPGSFYESGGFRNQGAKTKFYKGDVPRGYLLKKGDMLIAMTEQAEGLLGSALFVPENSKYLHNQRLGLVQIIRQERVCLEFLYLFFNAPSSRRQITEQSTGTKVKHTSPDRLCSVIGLIPPLPEQKKIAQILSTWDKTISTTEQLLANSQQQKKALMQQLLTGKKRLLDNNGVRFSGEWKQVKLSKIFERVTTKNNGKSSNVVTMSGQQGLIRQEDFFKKSVASEILDGYFLLKNGQFAYNKSYSNGYPMGAIKRLNRYDDGVVTTLYICFEISEPTKADSDFWEHYFESGLLNNGLSQIAHEGGRAHGLLNVKPADFFSLKVPLPSLDEQQNISAVLRTADQEVTALQQKLNAIKQEKKALMQQLLTGKCRVKIN
ncbi:restriction endonuclease subunit S [Aeromonas sp. D3]|uniref:restriction endonuclease subunit S n=1 Tax=Aeromonas sp. D3 TaxID=2990474 RepID=UPI0022E4B1D3|nr:restriction endonuclease subunit S [Aeromonas sp. D3]